MTEQTSLADVTAIIKTFERPACLDRLTDSIGKYYPNLKLLVADDSFEAYPREGVGYFRVAPDTGVAGGRNALLERVETPYFVLLDDDFEFTSETRLERFREILDEGKVPLVAGECIWCKPKLFRTKRKRSSWYGKFTIDDGHLQMTSGYHYEENGYVICDIVQNFFMARTDVVRGIGAWDADLKTNEHEEFFARFRAQGHRCGFCPEVSILHWHARPRRYAKYRSRDFRALAAQKMGIHRWTEMNGKETLFEDCRAA